MEKEMFDYVAERADILATADSSKQETKQAKNKEHKQSQQS